MNVEQITPAAAAELRAARKLITLEYRGLTVVLLLGKSGKKLTHVHAPSQETSGWLVRGAYDLNELDELALEDLKESPELSSPVQQDGIIKLHHDWHGYERPAAHHETFVFFTEEAGLSGVVMYPAGILGEGDSTHDAAMKMMRL